MRILFTSVIALFLATSVSAQSTWDVVYNSLQTNCVSCHSGATPSGELDLSGTSSDVYNTLVNQVPSNATAAAKGNKLVDPGYPERSFLLRKAANSDWDSWFEYTLEGSEGSSMPQYPGTPLEHAEIEMMRQWILFGASETETVVDADLISDYYGGLGMAKVPPPPAPDPSEGFQLRLGTFFLEPGGEIEFFKKTKLTLPADLEVIELEPIFNDESHHFILYRFSGGADADFAEGLRDEADGEGSLFSANLVAVWQNPEPIDLPATTAYSWGANDVLDMNYHLLNYSQDSILAADVYVNVYTQEAGVAEHEMYSQLLPIDWLSAAVGGPIGPSLVIPNDGQPHTFEESFNVTFFGADWYIWMLGSHTHSRGTDFDIYLRNPDGSRGEQVYEGFYNTDYTFNQGYYDWEHPPNRYFENPQLHVSMSSGLTYEAEYVNNTNETLHWGSTTEDEMMLIIVQYTRAEVLGVDEAALEDAWLQVAPNPFTDITSVKFHLEDAANVALSVFDISGRQVLNLPQESLGVGTHQRSLNLETVSDGLYLVRVEVDGRVYNQRVVKQ